MVPVFGFPDADGDKRKSQVRYGKLSRPVTKLSRPSEASSGDRPPQGRLPSIEPANSRLPSRTPATKSAAHTPQTELDLHVKSSSDRDKPAHHPTTHTPEVDEWDVPLGSEIPRNTKVAGRLATVKKTKPDAAAGRPEKHHGRREKTPAPNVVSPSKKRKRGDAPSTAGTASRTSVETDNQKKAARYASTNSEAPASHSALTAIPTRSLREGQSAPARLADMIRDIGTSSTKKSLVPSPEQRSGNARTVQTPPRQQSRPRPFLTKSASLTPKQSQLWNQLLDKAEQESEGSPLAGPLFDDISQDERPNSSNSTHFNPVKRATAGNSRPRLADRLKQDSQLTMGASSSDEDELSDSSEDGNSKATFTEGADNARSTIFTSQNLESNGAKHTYSQTRSYLQEVMSFEESLLQPLTTDMPTTTAKSKAETGQGAESDDEPSQTIRNVHELRAAGSRKRFVDDMEAISDDIKDHTRSAWSRRRSALMELSHKLLSSDFASRYVESSYATILSQELTPLTPADHIADTILFVIVAQLTYRELPLHLVDDMHAASVIPWLFSYIGNDKTPSILARDRINNMSKMSQETYVEFMKSVKEATFWGGLDPGAIGSEVLALKALQGILLKTRKTGQRQSVIANHQLVDQLASLVEEGSPSTTDLKLKPYLALSVLEAESASMAFQSAAAATVWTGQTVTRLVHPFSEMINHDDVDKDYASSYLRLLLNVTNNQASNCASFASTQNATPSLFSRIAKDYSAVNASEDDLDLLLLSLGLAINLAEHSDAVRQCIPPSVLDSLTQTFVRSEQTSSQASSLEQSRMNVAYGYLAILLANLCLNDRVKTIILAKLPGSDIEVLIRSVEEFLGYHRRVDSGEQLDEDLAEVRDETWGGFTQRLGAVLEKLRR